VPGASDQVTINSPGTTITYSAASGASTVASLNSTANLSITGGSLLVGGNSTISGALSMTGGALEASGAGVNLDVTGGATISAGSLYALGGASLRAPNLTNYSNPNTFEDGSTFQASGAGSTLIMSGLTQITGTINSTCNLLIQALAGGNVQLANLTKITSSYVNFTVDGTSSTMNLGALTTLTGYGDTLTQTNKATVSDANLTTVNFSSLTLGVGSVTFSKLTNFDASSVIVETGAAVSLPLVANYNNPNTFEGSSTFEATGAQSRLTMAGLTGLTETIHSTCNLQIQALAGGNVQLANLAQVTSNYVNFTADGAGATLNLSALTTMTGGSDSLTQTNTATLSDANLAKFAFGTLTVGSGAVTMSKLSDFDASSVIVKSGASVSLPLVTNYNNPNTFEGGTTFEATGAGSTLTMAGLTDLTETINSTCNLMIQALAGGNLQLAKLAQVTSGYVNVTSDGVGSMLNVASLTTMTGFSDSLTQTNSGTLSVANLASFTFSNLTVGSGNMTFAKLADFDASSVLAEAGASVSLPKVANYNNPLTFESGTSFIATGAGSTLTMAGLIGLTETINPTCSLEIAAQAGGNLHLANLTQVTSNFTNFDVDGADSTLNLPALTTVTGASDSIVQNNMGALSIGALATLTSGSLTLNNGNTTLSKLTNIDGSSVIIQNGATLSMPSVASYQDPNSSPVAVLQAFGSGSALTLAGLKTIGPLDANLVFSGSGSGKVSLPALTTVTSNNLFLEADGPGGTVSVPNLVRYSQTVVNNIQTSNGGVISLPAVPDLIVKSVSGPTSGYISQSFTLKWTDVNQGAAAAIGPWVDTVYAVSPDLSTNYGAIGSLTVNGTLGVGKSQAESLTLNFPARAGSYRFEVVANSNQAVAEGANTTNNTNATAVNTALTTFPVVTVVDQQAGYTEPTGTWATSTSTGYNSVAMRASSSSNAVALFTPTLSGAGMYLVTFYDPALAGATTDVKITVHNNNNTSVLTLNEAAGSAGFVTLGNLYFLSNGTEYISISQGATNGTLYASAAQFSREGNTPSMTVPPSQTTQLNTALVLSSANSNAISISDSSVGSNTVQLTLSATNGSLVLATTAGLTFTSGANNSAAMTVQGTLAAINTALNGLKFTPNYNYAGQAGLALNFSDLGVGGAGPIQTLSKTLAIAVK
jgi:hypothetical protein